MYAKVLATMAASETRRDGRLDSLAGEIKGLRKAIQIQNDRVRKNETEIATHGVRIQATEDCAETLTNKVDALNISNARVSALVGGGAGAGGLVGAVIMWLVQAAKMAMGGP